ncbi:MAG: hypothetical protein ACRCS3_13045 [Paracoccaceae bacterium]
MNRLLAAFAFCAAPAFADQTLDLTGDIATPVPGTAITLMLTDVFDQRCPANVACVWEGEYRAEITFLSGTESFTTMTLCNTCDRANRTATLAGHTFTLVDLNPGRDVLDPLGRAPVLSDYSVTITISD